MTAIKTFSEFILGTYTSFSIDPCVICLDEFKPGDPVYYHTIDKVDHVFHTHCLKTMIETAHHPKILTCPLCKREISQRSLLDEIQLFSFNLQKLKTINWVDHFHDVASSIDKIETDFSKWRQEAEKLHDELKCLLDSFHLACSDDPTLYQHTNHITFGITQFFHFLKSMAQQTQCLLLRDDERNQILVLSQIQQKHVSVLLDNLITVMNLKSSFMQEDLKKIYQYRLLSSTMKSLLAVLAFTLSFSLGYNYLALADKKGASHTSDAILALFSSGVSIATFFGVDKFCRKIFQKLLVYRMQFIS